MATTKKRSVAVWVYFAIYVIHAIGFLIANWHDDVQGMVWCGFMGLMWFHLADKEFDK